MGVFRGITGSNPHPNEFYTVKSLKNRHPPTRLLQLSTPACLRPHYNPYPRFYVLHTAARLIKDLGPRDHITPTLKQLHPCPYCIQNLAHHVSHPFWNLSILHIIHGYSTLCFQVPMTSTIIHTWGFCCNSHKSEVWQSCFLGLRT